MTVERITTFLAKAQKAYMWLSVVAFLTVLVILIVKPTADISVGAMIFGTFIGAWGAYRQLLKRIQKIEADGEVK